MARSGAAAIGLVTFAFINLVLFLALSSPFGQITDMLEEQADASHMNVTSGNVATYFNNFKTVFGLMFVFSAIGLIIWFFLGTHSEEYEEY